jgi:hypothetical protein
MKHVGNMCCDSQLAEIVASTSTQTATRTLPLLPKAEIYIHMDTAYTVAATAWASSALSVGVQGLREIDSSIFMSKLIGLRWQLQGGYTAAKAAIARMYAIVLAACGKPASPMLIRMHC